MRGEVLLFVLFAAYAAVLLGCDGAEIVAFLVALALLALAIYVGWWLDARLASFSETGRHRRRIERFEAFAKRLDQGTTDNRGFFSGGMTKVRGEFEGRPVELGVRFGEYGLMSLEIGLEEGSLEFVADRPGVVARLARRPLLVTVHSGEPRPGLEVALANLLLELGARRVSSRGGVLRADRVLVSDRDLRLERLLDLLRSLSRVARISEPRGTFRRALRVASAAPEQRCPYCHEQLTPESAVRACEACGTVHHQECFFEARGCTVLGCSGAPRKCGARTPFAA